MQSPGIVLGGSACPPSTKRIEQNARRYNRPDANPRLLMRNNVSYSCRGRFRAESVVSLDVP
jgi:hypothetical protein